MAILVLAAIRYDYAGQVICGHCCSLPSRNLYLKDRRLQS
jgi:hypothetical protein